MALQFDGFGIVEFDQWTGTGDFSITIPSFIYNGSTQIIIGDKTLLNSFVACIGGGEIRFRVAGTDVSVFGLVDGQEYSGTFTRVGTTLTNDIAGVGSQTGTSSQDFHLDNFGKFQSGSLYDGIIGGVVTMTADLLPTRTYDFNQPELSTTLVDTTSGLDGTLVGFVSGGFLPALGTIVIDTLDGFAAGDYFCKQRNGLSQATFAVVGTTSGTVTSVEYQLDSDGWQVLDASPTASFSGSVTVTNQQDLSVRFGNEPSVNYTLTGVSAAACIAAWGQSNQAGQGLNEQTVTVGGGNPTPVMYISGGFQALADPMTTAGTSKGSIWPRIAQQYSDAGVPVCVGNVAVGGTSITQWQPATPNYNAIIAFADACQGIEFTHSIIGETDASSGMSTIDMETNMGNVLSALNSAYNKPHYLTYFPVGIGTGTTENVDNIRAAYSNIIATNSYVLDGGDLAVIDISAVDGLHLKTDQNLNDAGDIVYTSMTATSLLNITTVGAPDGTYNSVMWDETLTVVYSGAVNVIGNSLSVSVTAPSLVTIRGDAYDPLGADTDGMRIKGTTV
jgi:hypothetical protein